MVKIWFLGIAKLSVVGCLFLHVNLAGAGGPNWDEGQTFNSQDASKIQYLCTLNMEDAFKELKRPGYLTNRSFADKTIHAAFDPRRMEAIDFSLKLLMEPLTEVIEGQSLARVRDFNLVKLIFEAFPAEAVPRLLTLYRYGDGITRGNIIRVAGGIDGGVPIDSLLIEALDDKFPAVERNPEQFCEPLRVCDLAYSQLVLKFKIRRVLRTINPFHNEFTRDYHINILKSLLASHHYN